MKSWARGSVVTLLVLTIACTGGADATPTTPLGTETASPPTATPTPTVPDKDLFPTATPTPTAPEEDRSPTATPTPTATAAITPTPTATSTPRLLPTTPLKSTRPLILDYADRPPPIASLITIGTPAADGTTEVTGAAGAIPNATTVMVTTVEYADAAFVRSGSDGSFSASVLSAPGATVQVRYSPHPRAEEEPDKTKDKAKEKGVNVHQLNYWPGTLIRVADSPSDDAGTPFSSASWSNVGGGFAFWGITGSVAERAVQPGDDVTVSGTLRLYTPGATQAPSQVSGNLHFGVDLLFDAQGVQTAASSNFVSSLLTPTGLPIERNRSSLFDTLQVLGITLVAEDGALAGPIDTSVLISDSLPSGTYRLYAWLPGNPDLDSLGTMLEQGPNILIGHRGATVALITVGSPDSPRLSPMLLVDNPNQGTRGAIALEDKGSYEFTNRVATQSGVFVVEPRDRANGQPITYRLEPFFPFLSMADRNLPSAPVVPLNVPGGELTVTVTTPSGSVEALGSLPILQTKTGQRSTAEGFVLDSGGGNPGDVLQLTTLSDEFAYQFAEYGRYTISMSGSVPDVWGQEYPLDGTFEVWAAETLDIETASLPSTPFEAGDQLPAVVNVYPGVLADIEMSLELYPIDGSPPLTDSVTGTANRFGYFDGNGEAFELSEAGEYLVRVRASYTDDEGRLWMGTRRWGSGVASQSPALIAHGRRGEDSGQVDEQLPWFSRQAIGVAVGGHHLNFPYHSGDIVWATDDDSVQMRVSVQDTVGEVADLLTERQWQSRMEGPSIEERQTLGELPMLISTASGIEATFDPGAIDQWGYAYRAVERPGVRVRETVTTDAIGGTYWRFGDLYLAQRGMGVQGDSPNDVKWQFGAAVFKRPDLGIGEVAIYGSLWVEVPDDDPVGSRVFPPFQGAAGGPTGGPIMTLRSEEIDLFIVPTAVRPGAVLEVGDQFVFTGQVTSPSGAVRTMSGQANTIGYFAAPDDTFAVDEPGAWTVDVQVLHDGLTSAGQVEPPYPTGGVLGAENGRFKFFVVWSQIEARAQALDKQLLCPVCPGETLDQC